MFSTSTTSFTPNVDPNDPLFLHYEHEHIQIEFLRAARADNATPHVLVIGGGGYTFPRYAMEQIREPRWTWSRSTPASRRWPTTISG